jgi:hypothetical protein
VKADKDAATREVQINLILERFKPKIIKLNVICDSPGDEK